MCVKRSLAVVALALFCVALIFSAQTVTVAAVPILIPFILGILSGVITSLFLASYAIPEPGISAADLAQHFYSTKANEARALQAGTTNVKNTLQGTGYYFARKAAYAAMQYVNVSTYPTQTVLDRAGVLNETAAEWSAWVQAYESWLDDSISFANNMFASGKSYEDINFSAVNGGTTRVFDSANKNDWYMGFNIKFAGAANNVRKFHGFCLLLNQSGYLAVAPSWGYDTNDFATVYIKTLDNSTTLQTVTLKMKDRVFVSLDAGKYYIWIDYYQAYASGPEFSAVTNGFVYNVYTQTSVTTQAFGAFDKPFFLASGTMEAPPSFFTTLRVTYSSNTYMIDLGNSEYCTMVALRAAMMQILDFASSNAQTYWSTLRGLGYTDPENIPPNYAIPPVDVAFIANEDLVNMTYSEIFAMYLSYLQALSNFFNSSNWQSANLSVIMPENVSFISPAVKVNCTISRGGTVYANQSLYYFQVYQDLKFAKNSTVTLNQSGIVYDTLNNRVYTYQANDTVTVYEVWVKTPSGDYQQVDEATVKAYTVEAYVYHSDTYAPTPTPTQPKSFWSKYKWYLLGGALFILLIVFSPALNEMGKQWARAWR